MLGKFGLREQTAMSAPARVTRDAARITAPVLFHVQWHDELFPREGQLALFDLLPSPDKELVAYPGPHGETRPDAVSRWREFIARHLVEDG
ncbi:hypothetical protein Ais01nite_55250 [Asanoa ishikariensis]|uniref:hypothetical protein n=1 Tax=Asanoa ishikariensis TaxID=137265 RepID=UPI000B86C36D|nr:hypothetical protein [Asanoa ishikariensis]GIF67490.1 hypothetical protein Ais01nite_55250 [Asanoa ishikariensis]